MELLIRLEKQTVDVCDLDSSSIMKESPAVLSLGKLCEENGYSYVIGIQVSHQSNLIKTQIE